MCIRQTFKRASSVPIFITVYVAMVGCSSAMGTSVGVDSLIKKSFVIVDRVMVGRSSVLDWRHVVQVWLLACCLAVVVDAVVTDMLLGKRRLLVRVRMAVRVYHVLGMHKRTHEWTVQDIYPISRLYRGLRWEGSP